MLLMLRFAALVVISAVVSAATLVTVVSCTSYSLEAGFFASGWMGGGVLAALLLAKDARHPRGDNHESP